MTNQAATAMSHSMGQAGFKYLSTAGTGTHNTSNTCAIQVLTDSTVSCTSLYGDSLSSVAMTAGTIIVGEFSSVTCAGTGGELLAYLTQR